MLHSSESVSRSDQQSDHSLRLTVIPGNVLARWAAQHHESMGIQKTRECIACKQLTLEVEAGAISQFELHLIFEQLNP